jgi:hypothetical protein
MSEVEDDNVSYSSESDDTPNPLSQKDFLRLLRTYLGNEVGKVEQARATGAGWEVWLQVELCMYISGETAGDIRRESPYGGKTGGRADFRLNAAQPKGGTAQMLVEIKTNLMNEGVPAFVKRVGTDYDKQYDAPKGIRTLVVGVWVGRNPEKWISRGEVIIVREVVQDRVYLLQAGI